MGFALQTQVPHQECGAHASCPIHLAAEFGVRHSSAGHEEGILLGRPQRDPVFSRIRGIDELDFDTRSYAGDEPVEPALKRVGAGHAAPLFRPPGVVSAGMVVDIVGGPKVM